MLSKTRAQTLVYRVKGELVSKFARLEIEPNFLDKVTIWDAPDVKSGT